MLHRWRGLVLTSFRSCCSRVTTSGPATRGRAAHQRRYRPRPRRYQLAAGGRSGRGRRSVVLVLDGVGVLRLGDPPLAAVLLGQLILVGLAILGVRCRGPVSLLCWTMPALYLLGGSVILAVGRDPYFGGLVATNFHYLSDLTVPLVLAAAAAVLPVDPAGLARRASASLPDLLRPDGAVPAAPTSSAGRTRIASAVVLVAAVSLAVTATSYQRRWTANPTRDYLGTLVAELRADRDQPVRHAVVQPGAAGHLRQPATLAGAGPAGRAGHL